MNISRKTMYLLAVATLIITVIGASFAYFTSDIVDGEETIGLIETAKLGRIEYVTNVPEFSGILPGWEGIGYTSIYWISDSTTEASYTCTVNLEEDSYDQNIYIQTIEGEDGVIIEETPLTKEGIVVSRGTLAPETGINPPRTGEKHTVRYKVIFKELGVEQNDEQGKEIKLSSTCFLAPIEPEKHTVKLTVNGGYITTNNLREEERIVYYGGTTVFEIEADLGYDKESAYLIDDVDHVEEEETEESYCEEETFENDEKVCLLNDEIVSCDNEEYKTCIKKQEGETSRCEVKYDYDNGTLSVVSVNVTEDIVCEINIPESTYEYVFSSRQLRSFGSLKLANYGDYVAESFSQNDLDEAGVVLEGAEVIGENCSLNGTTAEATVYDDGKCEIEFEPKRYTVTFIVNGGKPISTEYNVAYASVLESGTDLPYVEALSGYTTDGLAINANENYAENKTSGCKVLGNKITAYVYSDFTCEINVPETVKEEDIVDTVTVTINCENCTIKSNQTVKEQNTNGNVHSMTVEAIISKYSCNQGTCNSYPSVYFELLPSNKYTLSNPYISCDSSNYKLEEGKHFSIMDVFQNVTCTIKADPSSSILARKIVEDNPVTRVANLSKKAGKENELDLDGGTGSLYYTSNTIDDSEVLYYRGNVKNNWVIFGLCTSEAERLGYNCKAGDALYWRILRTNTEEEGGGVRLIYAGSGPSKDKIPADTTIIDEEVKIYRLYDSINSGTEVYTSKTKSGFSSIKGYIGSSPFNSPSTSTQYGPYKTGYMGGMITVSLNSEGEANSVPTLDDLRTNTISSSVKTYIDRWYQSIFLKQYDTFKYDDYVNKNAVYCANRSILKKTSGTTETADDKATYFEESTLNHNYYTKCVTQSCMKRVPAEDGNGNLIRKGAIYYGTSYDYDKPDDDDDTTRIKSSYDSTNPNPTLKCESVADQFTESTSSIGNKDLTYPVALISADEVYYAGGKRGYSNKNMWLNQDGSYICKKDDKPCNMESLDNICNIKGVVCKQQGGKNISVVSMNYISNTIIGASRWWTMTPTYYSSNKDPRKETNKVYAVIGKSGSNQNSFSASQTYDYLFVRPVLSLKYETYTKNGNGTVEKPYIFSEYPEYVATVTCEHCKINSTETSYSKSVEAYNSVVFNLTADEGYMIRRANTSGGCYISGNNITTGTAKIDSVSNHTQCKVIAVPIEYDVSLSGTGFTVVGNSSASASPSASVSLEISAKEGYDITTATTSTSGCEITGSGETRTVVASNLSWDKTCVVSLDKTKYRVTVNVTGGTSSPSEYDVSWGEEKTFRISANTGYNIDTLRLDSGNCTLSGTTLKVTNVKETITCNLSMDKKQYNVQLNLDGATTNDENPQITDYGDDATFTITPETGYDITTASTTSTNCEISGTGSTRTVTVKEVTGTRTCRVSLNKLKYTVTVSCTNCTSSPTSKVIEYDGTDTFTIAASSSAYTINGADVSPASNCSLSGSTLTAKNITGNTTCTVKAKTTAYYIYSRPIYNSNASYVYMNKMPPSYTTDISTYVNGTSYSFIRSYVNGNTITHEVCLSSTSRKYTCTGYTTDVKTLMQNEFGSSNIVCNSAGTQCSLGSKYSTKPYMKYAKSNGNENIYSYHSSGSCRYTRGNSNGDYVICYNS